MNHIILYEPEIPQNTGNIIRLCANTGFTLHLIEPLGFTFNSNKMRRAGLDYHDYASIILHKTWHCCLEQLTSINATIYAISTKGKVRYDAPHFTCNDAFLFGPETRGLPNNILDVFQQEKILRIPMQQHTRSLNLSNAAAIVLFEVWRQQGFQANHLVQ